MAKFKVSELTEITTAQATDLLYIVQSNTSKRISVGNLLSTYVTSGNSNIRISSPGGNVAVSAGGTTWRFNPNGTFTLPILSSAPANVTAGSLAIADGSGWNPANTGAQTIVCYINSIWTKLN